MEELKPYFGLNKINRERALGVIENLTLDQLTKIPEGFNNNLLWNFGHIMVTQQLLVVGLSQSDKLIPDSLIEQYRKGSMAKDIINPQADLDYFVSNSVKLIERTQQMSEGNELGEFTPYQTSYGVELNSLKDAVVFNNLHEALHIGYMMAMKRVL